MIAIFFAEGFEEIEALATVDILRRASLPVVTVSIYDTDRVTGAHGIGIQTDKVLSDLDFAELSAIVLPGGTPGFSNLEKCQTLMDEVISISKKEGKLLAAICGAPSLLGHLGLLSGKHATIYPGMESHLTGAFVSTDKVVADGDLITSRGAGTAIDFALAITEYFKGKDAAKALAEAIVYQ